jgi:hypothetical protein
VYVLYTYTYPLPTPSLLYIYILTHAPQCFDELIRQITINCAERGRLLLRMRDNIRMTVATYQKLYESGVAFGMVRKSVCSVVQCAVQSSVCVCLCVILVTCFITRLATFTTCPACDYTYIAAQSAK